MAYPADAVPLVRLLAGDADPGDVLLDDEGYETLIVYTASAPGTPDPLAAAVQAALAIAGRFSRAIDGSNGDVSRSYSQRATAFRAHAEALRTNGEKALEAARRAAALLPPSIVAGGLDGEHDFAIGMMDGVGTVLPGRHREAGGWTDPRAVT